MANFIIAAAAVFFGLFILGPIVSALFRAFGFYTVVQERQCRVYMLFGKVALVLKEPGLHLLWLKLGWKGTVPIQRRFRGLGKWAELQILA